MPKSHVDGTKSPTRLHALICLLLAVAIVAIYAQVARYGTSDFDDPGYVYDNPHVRTGITLSNLKHSLTTGDCGNWHPITWVSHMLDCQFLGLDPGLHHLVNVAIHVLNSWLLLLVLSALTGSLWRSTFVAALFAVHPLNVESVAWIAERKNVLSTTFWLLTIAAYAAYARRGGWWRYALLLLVFALGLAAKPMLVTLPIVLVLLDIWPLRMPGVGSLRHHLPKLPLLAMVAASCWVTVLVQSAGGMTRSVEQFPMGQRVANAAVAYVAYIGKMLWPTKLCVLYPHPKDSLSVWLVAACVVALVALTIGAIWARRHRPYITVGWFWYLITLVPVIGIVQVGPQGMADRYAYVTLIGLFVAIAWLVPDLLGNQRVKWLATPAVLVLAALGSASWVQAHYWMNADVLFSRALKVTGYNGAAFYCRAGTLFDAGKREQALAVLEDALKVSKEPEAVHNFMGMFLARMGRPVEAVDHYKKALALKPDFAVAHNNLGTVLARLRRLHEAESHLRKAIKLEPRYTEPRHSLGVVLYWQGRRDEAIQEWKRALEINPRLPDTRRRLREAERNTR